MARHSDLTCRPFRTPEMVNRRQFLQHAGAGVGMLALAGLLRDQNLLAAESPRSRTTLAKTAALCSQGDERDLALHGRRA